MTTKLRFKPGDIVKPKDKNTTYIIVGIPRKRIEEFQEKRRLENI